MAARCGTPNCTLPHGHHSPHSFELNLGKRARKAPMRLEGVDDEDEDEGEDEDDDDDDDELDGGGGGGSSGESSNRTCPQCNKVFARADSMRRHAFKCTDLQKMKRLGGEPCTPLVPGWTCIVPPAVKFPIGTKAKSCEVKFMTLSNSHGGSKKYPTRQFWGGSPTWTDKELEAINAQVANGDNINTILICCMDPLTGDIYVWVHEVDLLTNGKYTLDLHTFKVQEHAADVIPGRHRSVAQLQLWLDHVETRLHSPPTVVIHLHPKGKQDDHYANERSKVTPEVKHLYGLGYAETSDTSSLSESWKFLSTRASIFNQPSIGDNFIATLVGKNAVARVKAFNELFAGADNTAIGYMGESIGKDVLCLLGAKEAMRHPNGNHHYDLLYFTAT